MRLKTMQALLVASLLVGCFALRCWAEQSVPPSVDVNAIIQQAIAAAPVQSVNGKTGAITTATLPGTYTVQSGGANPLPDPTTTAGRYANASDVGGAGASGGNGYAQLYSTGACWRRISSYASPQSLAAATSLTVKSLVNSSVVMLTGNGSVGAVAINITSACPGDVFTVITPSGVLNALTGVVSVSINGSSLLSALGLSNGTWADYVWTGTAVMKVRGGSL